MYLKRYLDGEHKQVWQDLVDLGPAVREESVYPDACAVAKETMKRVRHNIELLIQNLLQAGFVFGHDHRLSGYLRKPTNSYEPDDPTFLENTYLYVVDMAKQYWPVFIPADLAQRNKDEYPRSGKYHEDPLVPDMKKYMKQIEDTVGSVPLSVKAWYEEVGGANFYGFHPLLAEWCHSYISTSSNIDDSSMSYCCPLVVMPLTNNWKKYLYPDGAGYRLEFAPDDIEMDLYSGGPSPYIFSLPDTCADSLLPDVIYPQAGQKKSLTFVEYLRLSLSFGGFPGISLWPKIPEDLIQPFTKGLIPF